MAHARSFKHLSRLIKYDNNFDIISGAAGALIVALRCYTQTKNPEALVAAKIAAEKLRASAEPQEVGVAWDTMKAFNFPKKLGGVSHGVTGIAWVLSEWADFTQDKEWAQLARDAFAYEQSLFDQHMATWRDVRNGEPSCFWCYGAAGIGLAAHKMRKTLGNDLCEETISRAQDATWHYRHSHNHCLCHGSLGNAEIFRVTGDHKKADTLVMSAVNDYYRDGTWSCGMPDNAITPSLMCGLAGIGYGLLRHVSPATVPNILSLESPIQI